MSFEMKRSGPDQYLYLWWFTVIVAFMIRLPELHALFECCISCEWNLLTHCNSSHCFPTESTFSMRFYALPWFLFRYFTWDKNSFPNPSEMISNLSAVGRKMVTIVDPHIRRDDEYYVYKEAVAGDYLVLNKNGDVYEGWCWPGKLLHTFVRSFHLLIVINLWQ